MVYYVVYIVAAIVHFILRRNISGWKESIGHFWLSLLLVGSAIFRVVDHWRNGELFLIGKESLNDIMLWVGFFPISYIY